MQFHDLPFDYGQLDGREKLETEEENTYMTSRGNWTVKINKTIFNKIMKNVEISYAVISIFGLALSKQNANVRSQPSTENFHPGKKRYHTHGKWRCIRSSRWLAGCP
jgi:hypothetical protein